MDRPAQGVTALAFTALVVVGGGNGVAIRFSNRELAPFWGASLRFGLASLLFLVVVWLWQMALPRGRALLGTLVFGVLNFAAGYAFTYWALLRIQAGRAQTILAIIPLLTLILAIAQRQERFRWRGVGGALLALVGIGVISWFSGPGNAATPLASVAALIAAATCIAEATVLVKGFPQVPPAILNAIAMGTGAILLLGISSIRGERWTIPSLPETWLALGFLVVVGSLVVFSLFLFVLRRWPASSTSYLFVVVPVVAVILSSWLDSEALSLTLFAGGALVVVGVYIGALADMARAH
jgi:drug/metabolite transporter (DMT)-like permease